MKQIAASDATLTVHSEDDDMVHYNYSLTRERWLWDWWNVYLIHTNLSEGVVERGMSLQRFVDITSANAARISGLYPRKGATLPGSDADITVIDPALEGPLSLDDLHLEDYSIWEGWDIRG